MNNIFITTDTHFNHKRILELCYRPKDYEEKLKKAFSALSKPDLLIHLGDICMGNDKEIHKEYIQSIKAKKNTGAGKPRQKIR